MVTRLGRLDCFAGRVVWADTGRLARDDDILDILHAGLYTVSDAIRSM